MHHGTSRSVKQKWHNPVQRVMDTWTDEQAPFGNHIVLIGQHLSVGNTLCSQSVQTLILELVISTLLPCICIINSFVQSFVGLSNEENLEKLMSLAWKIAAALQCTAIIHGNLVLKIFNVLCSQYHWGIGEMRWTLAQVPKLIIHTPIKKKAWHYPRSKLYLRE